MGRPVGPTDYTRRLKAFELYAAGVKKADIASELGVTRPCIGVWCKKDKWDEKIAGIVNQADAALTFAIGNEVADALKHLRTGVAQRIRELESLCQPSNSPAARLGAIKAWLELAGLKRAMPNPGDPTTPKSLELIEDLLHDRANLERNPTVGITSILGRNLGTMDSGRMHPEDSTLSHDLPSEAPNDRENSGVLSSGSGDLLLNRSVLSRSIDPETLEG